MATKTISVDLEAYDKLVKARATSRESFSQVIKRAQWPERNKTAGALLEIMKRIKPMSDEILDQLEENQRTGRPPANKWK